MCPRGLPNDFKVRTTYGDVEGADLADWPLDYEELEPFYREAESKMGVSGRGNIPQHRGNNNFRVMALGAKRMGYTDYGSNNVAINAVPRDGRNACDQIGFCMQGCRSGAKWSTFVSELPRAEATGHCEIRTRCMALRIEHDDRWPRKWGSLRRCLRRSSLPEGTAGLRRGEFDRDHAAASQLGVEHVAGRPRQRVGQCSANTTCAMPRPTCMPSSPRPVRMYRGMVVCGVIRDEARHDPARRLRRAVSSTAPSALACRSTRAFLSPGRWGRDYTSWIEAYERVAGLFVNGEDMAIASNQVTLHPSEKDEHGLPIPRLNLDDHPNDLAMKRYAYRNGVAMLEAAGALRVFCSPPLPVSHNLGTCRMSENPDAGVVDRWGRSHEIPNLFVSDGSQFTSALAGNPTLTIVALAIRQAGHIARQMGRGEL